MLQRAVLITLLGAAGLNLAAPGEVQAAGNVPPYVSAAVADPARPDEDRQRDAGRKPAETLAFTGIKPGDKVIELVPGRGYFTRLLSKLVGPKGHVYAFSPPRRPNAAADSPDPVAATQALAQQPGYSNITAQAGPLAAIQVPEPVDAVFTAQNYHDLHNAAGLDLAAFNRMVFAALKPGGTYIVIDHAAAAGSGASATSTLHRIDPQQVKTEVEAAGFVAAGESNVLQNPSDPHTAAVFDPAVRGHTDQFIFRFRKPGGKPAH